MTLNPTTLLSAALAAAVLPTGAVLGYVPIAPVTFGSRQHVQQRIPSALFQSTSTSASTSKNDPDLMAFADTLDEETEKKSEEETWQACVDELLDPSTPLARRQTLLAKLVNANKDIQESVLTALRDRKVCNLLFFVDIKISLSCNCT